MGKVYVDIKVGSYPTRPGVVLKGEMGKGKPGGVGFADLRNGKRERGLYGCGWDGITKLISGAAE